MSDTVIPLHADLGRQTHPINVETQSSVECPLSTLLFEGGDGEKTTVYFNGDFNDPNDIKDALEILLAQYLKKCSVMWDNQNTVFCIAHYLKRAFMMSQCQDAEGVRYYSVAISW